VLAFSYIFLGFLPSHVSMKHILIIEPSWKVTLIARLYIWIIFVKSEEDVLLGEPFICSLFMELGLGISHNYLLLLRPIYILG